MTKQAPLPWTLTQNSWQYTTIYDAAGNSICRLDLEDWSVTEENPALGSKLTYPENRGKREFLPLDAEESSA